MLEFDESRGNLHSHRAPSQVMPLKALLAPVCAFKDRIAAAFEGLSPEYGGPSFASASTPSTAGLPCRALGPALLAVLDYLQVIPKGMILSATEHSESFR